ncbi:MAG: methylmalonyl-CoA epimerase [Pseudomonadota bacterium]
MTRRIDHIGIAVEDLDRALAFWRDALGLEVTHVEDLPERGLRVAMLPLGDTRLELIASTREDSEIARTLHSRGPGLHHLCLLSDAVDAELTRLGEGGTRLIDRQARPGADGARVGFVHPKASGGVLVELSQPGP